MIFPKATQITRVVHKLCIECTVGTAFTSKEPTRRHMCPLCLQYFSSKISTWAIKVKQLWECTQTLRTRAQSSSGLQVPGLPRCNSVLPIQTEFLGRGGGSKVLSTYPYRHHRQQSRCADSRGQVCTGADTQRRRADSNGGLATIPASSPGQWAMLP